MNGVVALYIGEDQSRGSTRFDFGGGQLSGGLATAPRVTAGHRRHGPSTFHRYCRGRTLSITQVMSDRSIDVDDLVEENKYLRQELFALCDRIREAEAWTRSHRQRTDGLPAVAETDESGDTDQLSVLESEIVQIRLTNFELLQKLKQLETARLQAQEESKRLERELQRLLPSALEVTRLHKTLDAVQLKYSRLQLAHRVAAAVWRRSVEHHCQSQSQQCASQASHEELTLQHQAQQLQLSRRCTTLDTYNRPVLTKRCFGRR